MLYTIMGIDKADSLQSRVQSRPQHLARLKTLQDEGRLILAGPHPAIDSEDPGPAGFSGSLIVAEFADLETAQAWQRMTPIPGLASFRALPSNPSRRFCPDNSLRSLIEVVGVKPPRTDRYSRCTLCGLTRPLVQTYDLRLTT